MAHAPILPAGGVEAGRRPERPPPPDISVMGLLWPPLTVTEWADPTRGGGKADESDRAGFCTAIIWPPEADRT
jgi:hypothetical protein